ncbi:MAG: hypothetical protein JO130_11160 [Solirubrobacterales bacterium]|nr:hypothetical protein [Solirubrobacterales bacterium]
MPDGVLRRLEDEPLSVPDRFAEHVAECADCAARRAEIADDAQRAARFLSAPHLTADVDAAWARLERELHRRPQEEARRRWKPAPAVRRRWRFPALSLRAGLVIGAIGVVVAGTAAAATLTTIFAPTHVAPVPVSRSDMQALGAFMGLGNGNSLGGFSTPSGSSNTRFGTISWSSAPPRPASSLEEAVADAGFPVTLPAHRPAGVGAVRQFTVQPRVSATVRFDSAAASLTGSTVTVHAGPVVIAQYGGTSATDVPTLAIATMPRPTAASSGASLNQIEAFLLAQPGIPPALAEEIRLLGDLRTTLPVPVPPGASVRSVQVAGWPGVLLADPSNAAAAVVWEDSHGILHMVAGILDAQDVLNVAGQLG